MFNKKSALFGAVIAVAAGLFGVNIAQINDNSQQIMTNDLAEKSPIYGHVTLVEKDPKGHIIAYRQTDNLIVNQGLNCMGYALFRAAVTTGTVAADTDACGGSGTATDTVTSAFSTASGFRWIQIGTSTVVPDETQTGLISPATYTTGTGTEVGDTATGWADLSGTLVSITNAGTGTSGTSAGIGATIIIEVTNMGVGSAATTGIVVGEVGLFDSPYSGSAGTHVNMFARQTFAPVTMSNGDTLAVTWQITLAHG